jgi:endo-1,4-beta-D-glucanase Y
MRRAASHGSLARAWRAPFSAVRNAVLSLAAMSLGLACGGAGDQPSAASSGPSTIMPFNSAPASAPTTTNSGSAAAGDVSHAEEGNQPNVSGLANTTPSAPAAAAPPLAEAPLSAEEMAQLSGFGGLVHSSDWKAPATPLITETTVDRAYLDWKSRFFMSCSDGSVYVLKDDNSGTKQVASEGIGYGMLLSVGIGDKQTFEGLWDYYKGHRDGNGVMNWLYNPCGGQISGNGASDADLDSAMALVLADSRWGGFADDAKALIAAIGQNESQQCSNGTTVLKPGDNWGGCDHNTVNPSYFSPGYYRRFAAIQTDRTDFWNKFAGDSVTMLKGFQSQAGGLLPDWGFGDGSADTGDRGQYGYEAVRSPWRVAVDVGWSGNADAKSYLALMSQTVDAKGGLTALANDDSFKDKRNSAFLGSLTLTGMGVDQAKLEGYFKEWMAYQAKLDDKWYYQATLRVLFLMTAGGFFPPTYAH